jgi:quinolinate synthase
MLNIFRSYVASLPKGNKMNAIFLRSVTKGDYVKRKEDSKKVYKLNGWCRFNKKYELQDVEDISRCLYLKGMTKVFTGFTY